MTSTHQLTTESHVPLSYTNGTIILRQSIPMLSPGVLTGWPALACASGGGVRASKNVPRSSASESAGAVSRITVDSAKAMAADAGGVVTVQRPR
eukprot:5381524-Prymnesium_polylepis.1